LIYAPLHTSWTKRHIRKGQQSGIYQSVLHPIPRTAYGSFYPTINRRVCSVLQWAVYHCCIAFFWVAEKDNLPRHSR
jgi:hypothetical protein